MMTHLDLEFQENESVQNKTDFYIFIHIFLEEGSFQTRGGADGVMPRGCTGAPELAINHTVFKGTEVVCSEPTSQGYCP